MSKVFGSVESVTWHKPLLFSKKMVHCLKKVLLMDKISWGKM